jgi:formylglycine-generating enzyme required for sulfatase activity
MAGAVQHEVERADLDGACKGRQARPASRPGKASEGRRLRASRTEKRSARCAPCYSERAMKRLALITVLLFFATGIVVIAWTVADLPPVRYVLRYGFSPRCKPTGLTKRVEGVEFIEIGPGIFRMGSDRDVKGGDWIGKLCQRVGLPWGDQPEPSNEMPVHWVEFPRGFWIAETEVTNAMYARFEPRHMRSDWSKGDDDPVVDIDWNDARRYCVWLSERSDLEVRLPSESEWECSARAGSETEYSFGDGEADLSKYAWYEENSEASVHQVATKKPNRWGLHDLHGNVWEWCEDTYHKSYKDGPTDGTAWTEGGEEWKPGTPDRVHRGGSWGNSAEYCRSANRGWCHPAGRGRYLGFRPAASWPLDP